VDLPIPASLPSGAQMKSGLLPIYFALIGLLALTAALSFIPMNNTVGIAVSIAIAIAKAALVIWFFMDVRESSAKIRFMTTVGFIWLILMIAITFGDYLSRGVIDVLGK
jgi:cytochrome c oxidase subunit 4